MKSKIRQVVVNFAVVLAAISAAAILACGPYFPNMLLTEGQKAILTAPVANFAREIERLDLPESEYSYRSETAEESLEAEIVDLREALQEIGQSAEAIAAIVDDHTLERRKLRAAADTTRVVEGLPKEFQDYFQGAIYWSQSSMSDNEIDRRNLCRQACDSWERLLTLPEEERRYKSTWASYMLGLAYRSLPGGSEKALLHFQTVRQLFDEGFLDSIALAAASFGQEGQIHFIRGELKQALELYLSQNATGDPTAIESLRMVAAQAFKPERSEVLRALASDGLARRVITAYLVSGEAGRSEQNDGATLATRWLALLEEQQVQDLLLAEQLALAAYQAGDMDLAKRWLARGDAKSVAVRWLRAKLLLYDGEVTEAAGLLANLTQEIPPGATRSEPPLASFGEDLAMVGSYAHVPARSQISGELGALRLARREFTEALDALLRSGYWLDAAYVAEKVLTTDELRKYVEANWPAEAESEIRPADDEDSTSDGPTKPQVATDIRYLLGRRLAREGRAEQARIYLPKEWVESLDEFIDLRGAGVNPLKGVRQRARYLFKAARIMREKGLELFSTETGPDWHFHGGSFAEGVTAEGRESLNSADYLAPSPDELERARSHAPAPNTRFHYRYTAAQLALEAAKLLPDNDRETALILCTAGSWIKNLDPKAADLFYKSLVRRCRKTPIGKEADQIRWFPRIDEQGNILPRAVEQPAIQPPPEQLPEFPPLASLAAKISEELT